LPKSPVGQAIAYARSNWAALCRYPEHGDLSIDNNLAERMLRAQALGRRYAQSPIMRSSRRSILGFA
jgi:transposase